MTGQKHIFNINNLKLLALQPADWCSCEWGIVNKKKGLGGSPITNHYYCNYYTVVIKPLAIWLR